MREVVCPAGGGELAAPSPAPGSGAPGSPRVGVLGAVSSLLTFSPCWALEGSKHIYEVPFSSA